ncbi:hypothetical protein HIM_05731 [Hirsutella minnesotensis 3608]|uniref:Aminoglycoside phosphotransferase domain-containing protein n=1 Tax=Hirsutella minnesotensis 3608 TaxID=1043627 RepID=A0A0F7ZZV7_9HYPO|nr:hypothetical protein HIM_05731 [Hirsutella minnesotensis 3608]
MDQKLKLQLEGGEAMALSSAQACPDNVLHELEYPRRKREFRQELEAITDDIEALVCRLLGIRGVYIWGEPQWDSGSFNLVIPMETGPHVDTMVYLRLPFPHRTPTTASLDEKLRTEIATYLWMQENCPDVPIPTLHAFGLPDGQCYTHPDKTPFLSKLGWLFQNAIRSLLGYPARTRHVRRWRRHSLASGFLLLSRARGKSLPFRWLKRGHDETFRQNVCRGLVHARLSMNRVQFPRIASLYLDADGCITLSNRPLHLHMSIFEIQGVPGIPRDRTYRDIEQYFLDLLAWHDRQLLNQPNAILDQDEGREQLAVVAGLRSIMHLYTRPHLENNPIHLSLTDLQPSNIFVDEAGNLTTIIDLEFACTLPASMHLPPHWLTSMTLDGFAKTDSKDPEFYIQEYLRVFEEEEEKQSGQSKYASLARDTWESGAFWFNHAVMAPNVATLLFKRRIMPQFAGNVDGPIFHQVFSHFWCKDSEEFIRMKLQSTEVYRDRLRQAFDELSGKKLPSDAQKNGSATHDTSIN